MNEIKHTPGPWKWSGRELEQDGGDYKDVIHTEVSCGQFCYGGCVDMTVSDADKLLIAAAPELLEALIKALDFIEGIGSDLHNRRTADWYPEGANNAAISMSEDMRLLGNACADFDIGDVIAKATGAQS